MKQDQEQKCYVCKFCNRSFSNGKKLGGHMRCHLALISATRNQGNQESITGEKSLNDFNGRKQRIQENVKEFVNGEKGNQESIVGEKGLDGFNGRKQGIQENDQEFVNGENGVDFDNFDQDFGSNVYVLRENPKRSWRVSNSSKDYGNFCVECGKGFHSSKALASHKICHSRKVSNKNNVCEKCGKAFDSLKALYGHLRCHSIKRSQPLDESTAFSSSDEHDGVATPVRKKRSCTRYNSPKPCNDDEVEEGAICLMMLSMGVRDLDGVKLVISNQKEFSFSDSGNSRTIEKNVEFEVSVDDGSMRFCEFKNKNDLGLKKDLIFRYGSGQARSKDYKCPICFKEFASGQALGSHKRIHNEIESKSIVNGDISDIDFDQQWRCRVRSDIEWDPLAMVN